MDTQRTNMDYNHEISLQDSLDKQINILNLIFLFVHENCPKIVILKIQHRKVPQC